MMKSAWMMLGLCLALTGCAAEGELDDEGATNDVLESAQQLAGPGADGPDYDTPPPGYKPDLTVSLPTPAFYLQAKPNAYGYTDDHVIARAVVKNVGNWSTGTLFKVRMYVRGQFDDNIVLASQVVSTSKLEPGQQRVILVDFGLRASWINVHNVDLVAVADYNNTIPESNETNNSGFYYNNDF